MSKPEWALSMTGMVSHFDAGNVFVFGIVPMHISLFRFSFFCTVLISSQ